MCMGRLWLAELGAPLHSPFKESVIKITKESHFLCFSPGIIPGKAVVEQESDFQPPNQPLDCILDLRVAEAVEEG
jgi:hypothetical protein